MYVTGQRKSERLTVHPCLWVKGISGVTSRANLDQFCGYMCGCSCVCAMWERKGMFQMNYTLQHVFWSDLKMQFKINLNFFYFYIYKITYQLKKSEHSFYYTETIRNAYKYVYIALYRVGLHWRLSIKFYSTLTWT